MIKLPSILLLGCLLLTACSAPSKGGNPVPYEAWHLKFYHPHVFATSISYVVLLDEKPSVRRYGSILSTSSSFSVDSWKINSALGGGIGKGMFPYLPLEMYICWDSWVDQKLYQTHIKIPAAIREQMLVPREYTRQTGYKEKAYADTIAVGLAPGGKVRLWLWDWSEPNKAKDMIEFDRLESVSGEELTVCQGKTSFPNGYGKGYPLIEEYIKGKQYPYGEW